MSKVRIGIIGGSGLGEALGAEKGERRIVDTPFGEPSSPLIMANFAGVDVAILQRHGPGHTINPTQVPYRANIYALKAVGVTHIVASGATGSLNENIRPRDVVVPDQVIDRTFLRPSSFYEQAAVHVAFAEPYCPVLRRWLIGSAKKLPELRVHEKGTYVCMEGPAFSTRAESHMHRTWGGDLIGMTTMPEAKLAREAEIAYALIALPTDYDCWREPGGDADPKHLLQEIIGNLKAATQNFIRIVQTALEDVSLLESQPSPAHEALSLAIWTEKRRIPPEEISRLRLLWGRYFS